MVPPNRLRYSSDVLLCRLFRHPADSPAVAGRRGVPHEVSLLAPPTDGAPCLGRHADVQFEHSLFSLNQIRTGLGEVLQARPLENRPGSVLIAVPQRSSTHSHKASVNRSNVVQPSLYTRMTLHVVWPIMLAYQWPPRCGNLISLLVSDAVKVVSHFELGSPGKRECSTPICRGGEAGSADESAGDCTHGYLHTRTDLGEIHTRAAALTVI